MLKFGTTLIGFALVVAMYVPNIYNGRLIASMLLVIGMSCVIISPLPARKKANKPERVLDSTAPIEVKIFPHGPV